jgi:hypothetical protein
MKRKFLEELGLEKEVIDKVMAENGKDIEAAKSKEDIDGLKNRISELETDIKTRDSQLDTHMNSNADNETLQTTIKTLQSENKTQKEAYETKIAKQKREFAISQAVTGAKAKSSKAVIALLDDSKITIGEDGKIAGLDEQLKELQNSDGYLFDTAVDTGGGGNPANIDPKTKEVSSVEYYEGVFK